jgi:hypothetical protein
MPVTLIEPLVSLVAITWKGGSKAAAVDELGDEFGQEVKLSITDVPIQIDCTLPFSTSRPACIDRTPIRTMRCQRSPCSRS